MFTYSKKINIYLIKKNIVKLMVFVSNKYMFKFSKYLELFK